MYEYVVNGNNERRKTKQKKYIYKEMKEEIKNCKL